MSNAGTTNVELISLAKSIHLQNFYCIMIDEFNTITDIEFPLSIICNLQDSSKNGSHWCLCYIDNNQKIYYSSFGDPIPIQAKEFMMKVDSRNILSSDFQIQNFSDDSCGFYCMLILYLLQDGYQFEDIILSLVNE
jgi:hypothetical protein